MKNLIICVSIHHSNTEKIAKTMAEVLSAKLVKPGEVEINKLSEYDLIGFGSGIYFLKHHRALLNIADKLPQSQDKKAFIFSTRGICPLGFYHWALKRKLLKKGFNIAGEFSCKGFDTSGPFELIGGVNKGRPNKKDLETAKGFAGDIMPGKENKNG